MLTPFRDRTSLRLSVPQQALLLLLLFVLIVSGCFKKWGRDAAGAAVTEAGDRSAELVGPLRDSVLAMASRMYRDSLRPELESTVDSVLERVTRGVVAMEDTTAAQLEGRLTDALRGLVGETVSELRDSVKVSLGEWMTEFGRSARAELVPVATLAAESAVSRAVTQLNAGLDGPLRATVLSLVVDIADSVRAKAEQVTGEGWFQSIFRKLGLIGGLIAGGVIAAVVAAVIFVSISMRKNRQALAAVTTAIHARGTPDIRQAVQDQATARNVEGWLRDYLAKKNLLRTDRDDA